MTDGLTGLFLGAGASYDAGLPVVWELTKEIKRWLTPDKFKQLNAGWQGQGAGFSSEVVSDFLSILAREDVHYESILGYLEVQYGRKAVLSQQYHGLYSWFVELVSILLCERQLKNKEFLRRRLSCFNGIRTLMGQSAPLWVFSLNHDVVIEAVAAHFAIPIYSGFGEGFISLPRRSLDGHIIGELRAQVIRRETLEHGPMDFPNPAVPGIYLLKIHGALDVFTFNDGKDVLKLIPEELSFDGVIDSLRILNEEVIYPEPSLPGGKVKVLNEIAYADENGVMQFLRRSLLAGAFKFSQTRHQVLPKSFLRHFEGNINHLQKLICIGYGFGDQHVNLIIRSWLEFSEERRLEIVGPAAEIPAFIAHVSPQVLLVKKTATEYLDDVSGTVRSHSEKVERELSEIFRARGRSSIDADWAKFMEQESKRVSARLAENLSAALATGSTEGLQLNVSDSYPSEDDQALFERFLRFIKGEDGV
ncbi:hypothetical protein [Pseudomonas aestiva]|uniref:hypothetical protein n=1 Tax=Pseudomonas aestiva TaxID=3136739 RepID=UPI003264D740